MAKALVNDGHSRSALKTFTDCMYFINGHCKSNDKCLYRHCSRAAAQTNNCFKWPKTCRDINCPYRHPALPKTDDKKKKPKAEPLMTTHLNTQPQSKQEGFITFFWDIENVPIPKFHKPFDIVQRIRQKLVVEAGLLENNFTCYCNSTTISQENQLSLSHANVRIVHVPDRKPGAVDRQIMLDLDRFERAHRPPATIVLISGDIDFVGKLGDLRHQAGFHVIVIHNKPAKTELKATVNAHYPWELFTQPQPIPIPIPVPKAEARSLNSTIPELTNRTPQKYRMSSTKDDGNLHRINPSPTRVTSRANTTVRSISAKRPIHKCPKCTNDFESIQALRQHQEAKKHLFDCPICEETFVTIEGQTQHQKAKGHYSLGLKCVSCNRQFPKYDSLRQHQQATGHSGCVGHASSDSTEFFREAPTSATTPKPNSTLDDELTMIIIEQGIQAILQHYPRNKSGRK